MDEFFRESGLVFFNKEDKCLVVDGSITAAYTANYQGIKSDPFNYYLVEDKTRKLFNSIRRMHCSYLKLEL